MAVDIPAACWWRTDWAVVSYRVRPDYRPGTGSSPEHHRAPYRSLTTTVAVPPRSGPWLVAAGTRRTSKLSCQSWRKPLASFCCPWTSKRHKHRILQCSLTKKMECSDGTFHPNEKTMYILNLRLPFTWHVSCCTWHKVLILYVKQQHPSHPFKYMHKYLKTWVSKQIYQI